MVAGAMAHCGCWYRWVPTGGAYSIAMTLVDAGVPVGAAFTPSTSRVGRGAAEAGEEQQDYGNDLAFGLNGHPATPE